MLLAALLVLSVLLVFKVKSSFNSYGKLQWSEQWQDVRFLIWKPTWAMWKDNPIWGVGPDHFDHRYRQYRLPHKDAQTSPRRVHNDYLNTLADWGLVGAAIIVATLAAFYWRVYKEWSFLENWQLLPSNQGISPLPVVLGGSLGLLAILIHSWFDFNMHIPANALTAVAWMAFVTVQLSSSKRPTWISKEPKWRVAVTVVLVVVFLGLCGWTWRKSRETFWMERANACAGASAEQMSALAMAFAAEPAHYRIPLQLGECYRLRSWQGLGDYRELALEAITWFERSSQLNPYNPNSVVRHGMCLDWIGETGKADSYFDRAYQLDPSGYYINALVGWHYMQKEDYAQARQWFERSIELYSNNNFIAWFYLQQAKEKLGIK
jgi:O-antigen ligase